MPFKIHFRSTATGMVLGVIAVLGALQLLDVDYPLPPCSAQVQLGAR